MKQMNRFNRKVQKIIEAFLCIASVIMLAVNLAQVLFRYIFHASILWSEELSTYLYVWIIFFSLYAACRERNELNIAVISFKSPKKMKIVSIIREFLGLITCMALLAGSIPVSYTHLFENPFPPSARPTSRHLCTYNLVCTSIPCILLHLPTPRESCQPDYADISIFH